MNHRIQFSRVICWMSIIMMVCSVAAITSGQCVSAKCQVQTPNLGVVHPAVARIVNQVGNQRYYGSGTLVKNDLSGLLITCAHLFRHGAGNVSAIFPNGRCCSARVLKTDSRWDLAAIEVSRSDATPVKIAEKYPQPGTPLSSCGYGPDGRYLCNQGIAQGYTKTGNTETTETLQISGVARDGDSGGPIFNSQGQLAGVTWGTDGHMVSATYCGRIQKFLATIAAQGKPEKNVKSPPQSDHSKSITEIRQKIDLIESALVRIKSNKTDKVDPEQIRSIARQAARSISAERAESLIERILPGLLTALGWTGPPALAVMIVAKVLVMRLRHRIKATKDNSPTTGTLSDNYAKQLA